MDEGGGESWASGANRRQWTVVRSYDIADDKRRAKVMKTLEGYGQRAQYSALNAIYARQTWPG